MALTKTAQTVVASTPNTAGSTTTSSWFDTNYGVSGVAKIINGSSAPAAGCDFVVEGSNDGGTTPFEIYRQTAGIVASAVYLFPYWFGIGQGADFAKYRVKFVGNSGFSVQVQCDAQTTATV